MENTNTKKATKDIAQFDGFRINTTFNGGVIGHCVVPQLGNVTTLMKEHYPITWWDGVMNLKAFMELFQGDPEVKSECDRLIRQMSLMTSTEALASEHKLKATEFGLRWEDTRGVWGVSFNAQARVEVTETSIPYTFTTRVFSGQRNKRAVVLHGTGDAVSNALVRSAAIYIAGERELGEHGLELLCVYLTIQALEVFRHWQDGRMKNTRRINVLGLEIEFVVEFAEPVRFAGRVSEEAVVASTVKEETPVEVTLDPNDPWARARAGLKSPRPPKQKQKAPVEVKQEELKPARKPTPPKAPVNSVMADALKAAIPELNKDPVSTAPETTVVPVSAEPIAKPKREKRRKPEVETQPEPEVGTDSGPTDLDAALVDSLKVACGTAEPVETSEPMESAGDETYALEA